MDLLRDIAARVGVDDIIALMLVTVSSFIWLSGQEVPETLGVVTVTIVGFFFGKKYMERGFEAGVRSVNPPVAAPFIEGEEE